LDDCQSLCVDVVLVFNCHAYDDSCFEGGVPDGGPITVDCVTCPTGVGRRPATLSPTNFAPATSRLGDYLARAAHLEAASVVAFGALEAELRAHGAPPPLVRLAARSARDEVR